MKFGDRIKILRKQNNYSQDFVAKKLNISTGALSRYESNMYEPKSLELIKDFSILYDVSIDYLLGKIESNYSPIGQTETAKVFVYGSVPARYSDRSYRRCP